MRRWRVLHPSTRAIWFEYFQEEQPARDPDWPPNYILQQGVMNAGERRQWAVEKRKEWLSDRTALILDAILLKEKGDTELLGEIAQQYQAVLSRFPKDPGP